MYENKHGIVVAVDFDNTIARTEFPRIIKPIPNVIEYIHNLQNRGDTVILWTCREGALLQEALDWCADQGLYFDYVNENPPWRIELFGNDCRKIGADMYIDDKALPTCNIINSK